jgi:hypothetical protein
MLLVDFYCKTSQFALYLRWLLIHIQTVQNIFFPLNFSIDWPRNCLVSHYRIFELFNGLQDIFLKLTMQGNTEDVESFTAVQLLPTSLTSLSISGFPNLKYLDKKGLGFFVCSLRVWVGVLCSCRFWLSWVGFGGLLSFFFGLFFFFYFQLCVFSCILPVY